MWTYNIHGTAYNYSWNNVYQSQGSIKLDAQHIFSPPKLSDFFMELNKWNWTHQNSNIMCTRVSHMKTLNCILQAGLPSLHYYNNVVLLSCIVLSPVGHSSNHEYHRCQLTRQSSCVSNFYRTFKVFIWLSLIHFPTISSLLSKQQYNMLACNTLNTAFSQQDLENAWIYCPSQCKLMGWHHLKIQGGRRVTWSKFCTEDPQILGVITKNLLSWSAGALDLCTLPDVYLQTCKQGLFKDKMITLKDLLTQDNKCLPVSIFLGPSRQITDDALHLAFLNYYHPSFYATEFQLQTASINI